MKINRATKQIFWHDTAKVGAKGGKSFSNQLNLASQEHTKQQIKQMLKKINTISCRLKQQITESDIQQYKMLIKEYLSYILKNYYKIRRTRSIDYSSLYTRIEIIDQEVEQLTKDFLTQQSDTISLIAKIDHINGLLLDIYQ